MLTRNVSVKEIKATLLAFHANRGYRIFASFPLLSSDPTLLFTNATITPFKTWFTSNSAKPQNYALIQQCVRMGGASELRTIGINPYYFTSFEMFGSGMFSISIVEVVAYLFTLLNALSIEKERLYFIVPEQGNFDVVLSENGIKESRIFRLAKNGFFWQKWQFGKVGPTGHGLSVIFSRSTQEADSIEQLAENPEEFVELLNLIHIDTQTLSDGTHAPIPHPGFELGMGIERLAAVLQGCNSYQIDSVAPLVQRVLEFLPKQKLESNQNTARICADHLKTICILLHEDIRPTNKRHGYILRKLIRRFLEHIWVSTDKIVATETLIGNFVTTLQQYEETVVSTTVVVENIQNEERALKLILQKGASVLQKQPNIPRHVLYSTYGLSPTLMQFLTQNTKGETDET